MAHTLCYQQIADRLAALVSAYRTTHELALAKMAVFRQSLELQQFLKLTAQVRTAMMPDAASRADVDR